MSSEKVINYKVIILIEIYNIGYGRFSIRGSLTKLNFKLFF